MKYSEWKQLDAEQRKNTHWKQHPRIRIATIFSILFAIAFFLFVARIMQNRRIHVNRKPIDKEAFAIAKVFVKDKLKQPASASFPKSNFNANIDTLHNSYQIASTVDAQDSSGKIVKLPWQVKLAYKGGDWADRKSWDVLDLNISNNPVK
jgi:hypothetical protein